MNTKLLLALAVAALPFLPMVSRAEESPALISVSGSAEVKVAPDEIHLSVGVESRNENLAEAKRDNDLRISAVLAFLKKSGLPAKDVQTDYINIEPQYDNESRTRPVVYLVRKSIEIKLTQIDAFDTILSGLLTNGVNQVHGIDFRTSELRKYRDQARSMAIKAAREKADAMAADLGVKRGKVYSVSANDGGGWNGYSGRIPMFQNAMSSAASGADAGGDTLSIGQISVSASVNVSFLIQ